MEIILPSSSIRMVSLWCLCVVDRAIDKAFLRGNVTIVCFSFVVGVINDVDIDEEVIIAVDDETVVVIFIKVINSLADDSFSVKCLTDVDGSVVGLFFS